ncbi:MAG: PAS domain S-box protein, partial [Acidobacteriota bacterium]
MTKDTQWPVSCTRPKKTNLIVHVLNLIHTGTSTSELLRDVVTLLARETGFEAVGLRLKEGVDYPYFQTRGLSEEFIRLENSLCPQGHERAADGAGNGNVTLECACGSVIQGRIDRSQPFVTEYGSLWTNSNTELLAEQPALRDAIRGNCVRSGYETSALIPLRFADRTFGLLQFEDKRPGRLTAELLSDLEAVAVNVALALSQRQYAQELKEEKDLLEERIRERNLELLQANAALSKSERKYRELVEHTNNAIIRWKSDGTITFFNEYAQDFFGYREEEAIGRHVSFLLPDRESTGGDLTSLIQDIVRHPEKYVQHVNENICRDGRRVWMSWTNRPIFDKDGTVTEILAVGTDFTARKQMEQDLLAAKAESELRAREAEEGRRILNALMEYIPEGITIASAPDVVTTHMSSFGHDILARGWNSSIGFSMEDWLAGIEHYLPDGVTPAKVEDLPLWRAVKRGEVIMGMELVLRSPRGHLIPVLCNAGPIRGKDGKITGGVVAWRDISDRKRAEDQLKAAYGKLYATLESITDGFFALDREWRFTYYNEQGAKALGLERDEALGKVVWDLFPDAVERKFHAEYHRAMETSTTAHFEEFYPEPLNAWFECHAYPSPEGLAVYFNDITSRKQMEEALRRS